MFVAGLGMVLTAGYLLMLVRRVCMAVPNVVPAGAPAGASAESAAEAEPDETGHPALETPVPAPLPADRADTADESDVTGADGTVHSNAAVELDADEDGPRPPDPGFADLSRRELAAWLPLGVLTVAAGVWPALILAVADPAVRAIFGGAQ